MYVDNYEFKDWMQKLLEKLEEVGKDVKSLQTNPQVMPNDKLLDNQDLCLLFKVSTRTLQRLRSKKLLPFMMISGKAYYRASDVREFIKERFDVGTLRKFEKEHGSEYVRVKFIPKLYTWQFRDVFLLASFCCSSADMYFLFKILG